MLVAFATALITFSSPVQLVHIAVLAEVIPDKDTLRLLSGFLGKHSKMFSHCIGSLMAILISNHPVNLEVAQVQYLHPMCT